jgi:hypothetical protein
MAGHFHDLENKSREGEASHDDQDHRFKINKDHLLFAAGFRVFPDCRVGIDRMRQFVRLTFLQRAEVVEGFV